MTTNNNGSNFLQKKKKLWSVLNNYENAKAIVVSTSEGGALLYKVNFHIIQKLYKNIKNYKIQQKAKAIFIIIY